MKTAVDTHTLFGNYLSSALVSFVTLELTVPRPRKLSRRIPKARRLRTPALSRKDVTRAEYNRIIEILNERNEILNALRHNSDVQFQRIAQIQADVDSIQRALERRKLVT